MAEEPLRLLTRRDCGLCHEFLSALRAARPGAEVVLVDVDGDPLLRRRYGTRIPVLLDSDGEVLAEGRWPDAGSAGR